MELRHLRLVQTVAEEKTLSRAAEKLFLSQSALSHQLREAEGHLGVELFTRMKKKMILTSYGERLLLTADRVLQELDTANREIKSMKNGDSGELRVSTACYTCYHWLSPFLKEHYSGYPNVEVTIVPEAKRNTLEYLEEGKLDLAIVDFKTDNKNIAFTKLFEDEFVIIMSPKHPLRKVEYMLPENFAGENFFLYNIPDDESTSIKEIFKPSGIFPKKILRIELTEAILEMVKAEMGIAMFAKWAVKPELKSKELIGKRIFKNGLRRTWYAATLKNKQLPKYMESFVDYLSRQLI